MNEPIRERLKKKFGQLPKWAEDFSVETKEEESVSRRDFIRFLSLVSLGLFMGTAGVFFRSLFEHEPEVFPGVKIAELNTIAVGESSAFMIPGKKEPGILVRLGEDRYVAYGQKCTHLQCPVLWKKEVNKLVCPCHNGAFAVEDGRVLYGPPERPLPQLELNVRNDGIYFVGVKNGELV
ncbi:MAG: ubiquinol-cytochrome c reductase iron-sulfur subunit [Patescibacteria group bacterium]